MASFEVCEAGIADIRAALDSGAVSCEQLVTAYLERIEAYDRERGPQLNAIVVMNPDVVAEARAADRRRARGETRGPLDGIPYTAKDSYKVRGLTVAAGSPAFKNLVAQSDAFVIERLRAAGAILIGLTNMPPMAKGGMPRGVYGRAESPYNKAYLTAAFASGSSNGSGTATAASFAAFGLAEETWSSGRTPASNNALCAYTPSRGVISMRGNWPLYPTMDVVVPHTRSMRDMLEVLDVIVTDDPESHGDFWRMQPWIGIPRASAMRPAHYGALLPADRAQARAGLNGLRLGVPGMYINDDPQAGTGELPSIYQSAGQRIETRASIMALWQQARQDLAAAGAEGMTIDFPAVSNYEGDRAGAPTIDNRGFMPSEYLAREAHDFAAHAWDDFLRSNGDPALHSLADVDGEQIFPHPPDALPDRYGSKRERNTATYPELVRRHRLDSILDLPWLQAGV